MLIFFSLIVLSAIGITRLVHKAVDEYSYYGSLNNVDYKHVDLFYYQARVLEKQSK